MRNANGRNVADGSRMGRLDGLDGFEGLRRFCAQVECTEGLIAGDEEGMKSVLKALVITEREYADQAMMKQFSLGHTGGLRF